MLSVQRRIVSQHFVFLVRRWNIVVMIVRGFVWFRYIIIIGFVILAAPSSASSVEHRARAGNQ